MQTVDPPRTDKIFSHLIAVDEVPEQGLDLTIAADEATRRSLVVADGLAGMESLEADFHVARRGASAFNVTGTMRAKVTQICVVSLEPFDSEITEEIDVDFAPPAAPAGRAGIILGGQAVWERDPPDPIVEGTIDLGALAAEFLALGLDPHPRKPGVTFAPIAGGDEDADQKPFEILKKLSDRA